MRLQLSGRSAHQSFTRAMLQSAIGAALAFSIAEQNPVYFMLTTLGIVGSWLFAVRPNRPVPRSVINTTLLAVLAVGGIEMLRVGVGINAFAVFIALLLVVKLLDLREPRDEGQVMVLVIAILISAVLTSNSMMTGLLMLLVCIQIFRAMVLFQIHAVLHKSAPTDQTIHRNMRIDIRSMITVTAFLCALVGTVVFLVLPRDIGMQAFGQWGGASVQSVSGFTDSVQLGRPGRISESPTPVLDLGVTDRDGKNIGGENTPPVYLRGAVLDEYNDGVWKRKTATSRKTHRLENGDLIRDQENGETLRWERRYSISFRQSQNGQEYLFTPWKTVELNNLADQIHVRADFDRGVFLKEGVAGRVEYALRVIDSEFDEIDYSAFSQRNPTEPFEFIDSAIAQLAREVLIRGGIEPSPKLRAVRDDLAAVRLIERHLEMNYSYTLDSQPIPAGEDATKWFLFEQKKGHCEYYASALTLMARSVGIPARVITGYVVSDFNPVTEKYVVRQSSAHAWVEAQIAPGHWRTFDGTPVEDFQAIHKPQKSIWRSVANFYDSIESLWVKGVVGYDTDARQSLLGESSTDFGLGKLSDAFLGRLAAGRSQLFMRGGIVAGVVFAMSLFVGIAVLKSDRLLSYVKSVLVLWIQQVQRQFTGRSSSVDDPRIQRLETLVYQKLKRLDVPKPIWKPLKQHVTEHRDHLHSTNETTCFALLEASNLLYKYRFSSDARALDNDAFSSLFSRLSKSEKSSKSED